MSSRKIIQTIKRDLKSKGISYREVAIFLEMTEAGVKKLLSKEDISFNKLKLICDLLQTSPQDIISTSVENETEAQIFSEKQLKFFLRNRHYFHFFMKLAYEQKTPKMIQEEYQISTKSLNLYLKNLEELGLVKRHLHDRMQIVGGIPLVVKTIGTPLELEKYEIAVEQLQTLKEIKSEALRGAGLFLTDSEKEQFLGKILELVVDFSGASRSNRKKKNTLAKEHTFMSFINDGSMFNKILEI